MINMIQMQENYFNEKEKAIVIDLCKELMRKNRDQLSSSDINTIHSIIKEGILQDHYRRDKYGINPTIRNLNTALLLTDNIGADRNMLMATLLYNLCKEEYITEDKLKETLGADTTKLIKGLLKISTLYKRQAAVESDNFHKLLLTFAEDIRVIIIMIVDRLAIMRAINHHPNEKFVTDISNEAKYLYAPLAHRLGLYKIKSELEDLSFKYLNRETFTQIAHKLNETKVARERYIAEFIAPLKKELEDAGLKFEIKGRTKSISSIWNKMKKQNADVTDIFDLFAIRIILDAPLNKEKFVCWTAYSIVTNMYKSNPSRYKDWITIPKSNGYESLHITVNGPENKWVEVQIRTVRMDEIAERGLAAHWKYKGIKSEGGLDEWMNNVRDILESGNGPQELMKNATMHIYDDEVFVFTPKGDLYKFPVGATLLDFAFHIHSRIGCSCIGGKVNGKNQKINYQLKSGDTIEILTSSTQTPKTAWLNIVVTSKAKNKIKQSMNEIAAKAADLGKELLQRRFKNRKIDVEEAVLMRVIKKMGYKTATDFFKDISKGDINANSVIEAYEALKKKDAETAQPETAENFILQPQTSNDQQSGDSITIGDNLKNMNYKFSKCCTPIYGDDIVGFVSSEGVVKIHRSDCGNVHHLIRKYPYRKIKAAWTGKLGSQFAVNLKILGQDDIGIVTNITSLINKEKGASLRSISIDSNDGLFQGYLVIGISDKQSLNNLINKIKNVKGVKDVQRNN